jgi:Zn-dependent protease
MGRNQAYADSRRVRYFYQVFENFSIEYFILRIPAIFLTLTIHECAHGWVAWRLGDPTARDEGRITLNPLAHLDPFGALMLLLGPFGWARPVPVNGNNFQNPKRGILWVSLAGPASNILLAIVIGFLYRGVSHFFPEIIVIPHLVDFVMILILINIGIAFFNLIPVPPLDGSNVLASLLPNHLIPAYFNKIRYVPMILVALLVAEWSLHIRLFSAIMDPIFYPFQRFWFWVIFWQ